MSPPANPTAPGVGGVVGVLAVLLVVVAAVAAIGTVRGIAARALRSPSAGSPGPSTGPTLGIADEEGPAGGGDLVWDECRPVTWILRPGPKGSAALARRAIAELGEATGLSFAYGGETDRPELPDGATPDEPVLVVGWATLDELPGLAGDAVGLGGAQTRTRNGHARYLGGAAFVERGADLTADFGDGASQGGVLLHELGHAVGLGHSADPDQTMYESVMPGRPAAFQGEDLGRLARVAERASC